jgi:RNA polymerase sigma factor (sigma-70 family)
MGLSTNKLPLEEEDGHIFSVGDGSVTGEPEFLRIGEKALHLLQEPEFIEKEEEKIERKKTDLNPRELTAELYAELRPQLYRYVNNSLRIGADQTREVIQETFLRLMAHLANGEEIENPRGWAVRVAHNLAVDIRRKQNQQWKNAEEEEDALETDRADPSLNQEELLLEEEQMQRMKKALLSFPLRHRQCFAMRLRGFRYKDIAEAMNINEQRAAEIVKLVTVRLAVICG